MRAFLRGLVRWSWTHYTHLMATGGMLTVAITVAVAGMSSLRPWEIYVWAGAFISWIWTQALSASTAERWKKLYYAEKQKRQAIWS